jgi:hypothetical protein
MAGCAGAPALKRDPREPSASFSDGDTCQDHLLVSASIRAAPHRRYAFAHERVGFLKAGASVADGTLLLFAIAYKSAADQDYERDPFVGARIRGNAIGKVFAYQSRSALLHVHAHGGRGTS